MNKKEFIKHQEKLLERVKSTTKIKNKDYSSHSDNPFGNFESVTHLGIGVEQGFLVRMNDKMMRLSSFAASGQLHVKDESVDDTIQDLIGYATLLSGYIKHSKEKK